MVETKQPRYLAYRRCGGGRRWRLEAVGDDCLALAGPGRLVLERGDTPEAYLQRNGSTTRTTLVENSRSGRIRKRK